MNNFPEFFRIPLADWIDALMDWLLSQFSGLFDAIGHILLLMLLYIERFFLWLPWWLVIVLVGVVS
jgi:glycine betaine/proline transport system permease protein